MDLDSIVPRGKYWQAWFLWDYDPARKLSDFPYAPYRSVKALNVYDCNARTSAALQNAGYSDAAGHGENVFSWAIPLSKAEFNDVIPDTIGEITLSFVCMAGPSRQRTRKP